MQTRGRTGQGRPLSALAAVSVECDATAFSELPSTHLSYPFALREA